MLLLAGFNDLILMGNGTNEFTKARLPNQYPSRSVSI
jgi:hypothetical protein